MDDDTKSTAKDDYTVRMYQDEDDTDENATDPIIPEETDDPTRILQVPPDELRHELDRQDLEHGAQEPDLNHPEDEEDMREAVEDQDENMGDTSVY